MDALAELLVGPRDGSPHPEVRLAQGTVTAVNGSTLTVSWSGGTGYTARHLTGYVPAANDRVMILHSGGQLLVLGKVA